MDRKKHYLLIKRECSGATGKALSAMESASALLEAGVWPLWEHTRNRVAIAEGDKVAVYLSGDGGCRVVATAIVSKKDAWTREDSKKYPLVLDGAPYAVLRLKNVKMLKKPVTVKDRLERLTFIKPGSLKWGVCFMGGSRALSESDYQALVSAN